MPIVIDLGANIGAVSLLAAAYGCRVILVEPQSDLVDLIVSTINKNGWSDRAVVYRAIIGDISGQKREFNSKGVFGSVSNFGKATGTGIPVVAVDDLLPEQHYGDVHLMKIDVEGFDKPVLQGANKFFFHNSANLKNILWELKHGRTASKLVIESLHQFGFDLVTYPHISSVETVNKTVCVEAGERRSCGPRDMLAKLRTGGYVNWKLGESAKTALSPQMVGAKPCCFWQWEDVWASKGMSVNLAAPTGEPWKGEMVFS